MSWIGKIGPQAREKSCIHPGRPIIMEKEAIDSSYIARLLGNDWGFYHTVIMNPDKVRDFVNRYELLSQKDRATYCPR